MVEIFSPSTKTSPLYRSVAVTMVPFLMSSGSWQLLRHRRRRCRAGDRDRTARRAGPPRSCRGPSRRRRARPCPRSRREEVAARIDEVGRAVEAADVPRRLGADAVAARHEVAVGDGVRRLLELPQVLRQARDRRRRIEDDLGAVQPEQPRAFGKVPVVADVDADRGEARLEDRIAEVARLEEVLLPEAGRVRDVVLAVLPEIRAVARRRRRRCCSRRRPARARRPARPSPSGTSSRSSAISSVVGPGTGSAMSYQCASCDGQK